MNIIKACRRFIGFSSGQSEWMFPVSDSFGSSDRRSLFTSRWIHHQIPLTCQVDVWREILYVTYWIVVLEVAVRCRDSEARRFLEIWMMLGSDDDGCSPTYGNSKQLSTVSEPKTHQAFWRYFSSIWALCPAWLKQNHWFCRVFRREFLISVTKSRHFRVTRLSFPQFFRSSFDNREAFLTIPLRCHK